MRVICSPLVYLIPAIALAADSGTFRAASSLVLVNVSVLDSRDRPVTSLSREQFQVLDNGAEQPIRFFAHEDAPMAVAVILDMSGSMQAKFSRAKEMLGHFCDNLVPGDEMFVIGVEQEPRLIADYSKECEDVRASLAFDKPHGTTALLDAIPMAVKHLKGAKESRHIILVISDGGENSSRVHLSTIRSMVREANAQIYSATLGLEAKWARSTWPGDLQGPELLGELAELTGGRAFSIEDRRKISEAAASLAREIHDQYVIGYQPPSPNDNGRYHRISVKVHREPTQPRFALFHRNGYREQ